MSSRSPHLVSLKARFWHLQMLLLVLCTMAVTGGQAEGSFGERKGPKEQDLVFHQKQDLSHPLSSSPSLSSSGVQEVSGNTPRQVRLALTETKGQRVVQWYTEQKPSSSNSSLVLFGPSPSSLSLSASGSALSYSKGNWVGWVHTVLLSNLSSNAYFYYKVGDEGYGEYSGVKRTWVSGWNGPQSYVWYGDMGAACDFNCGFSLNTSASIHLTSLLAHSALPPPFPGLPPLTLDAVFHVGDIAYADFDGAKQGNQTIWNIFLEEISNTSSVVPYMVCPGNHDVFYRFESYSRTFAMPVATGEGLTGNGQWWAMGYGQTYFVAINTEELYEPFSPQHTWLENTLRSYSLSLRSQYPWLIVFGHRPPYCSNAWEWCNGDFSRTLLRESTESLFYKYGVNAYIAGHTHSYERTYPVYKGKVMGTYENPGATVYLVAGMAGDREGQDLDWQPTPSWSASHSSNFGITSMTIFNSTHLLWSFIDSHSHVVLDQMWLLNPRGA
eukprot:TRINITY_DN4085_c0_g1_i1.p1 TRINITY_DN4085_c0_g1~~TRINITY_DN4085_c0_g1_i1.p1  ORF type:complete len:505 (+),score=147.09 TRINITY_DN4085_c0_g1_i1:27-1517(+)